MSLFMHLQWGAVKWTWIWWCFSAAECLACSACSSVSLTQLWFLLWRCLFRRHHCTRVLAWQDPGKEWLWTSAGSFQQCCGRASAASGHTLPSLHSSLPHGPPGTLPRAPEAIPNSSYWERKPSIFKKHHFNKLLPPSCTKFRPSTALLSHQLPCGSALQPWNGLERCWSGEHQSALGCCKEGFFSLGLNELWKC